MSFGDAVKPPASYREDDAALASGCLTSRHYRRMPFVQYRPLNFSTRHFQPLPRTTMTPLFRRRRPRDAPVSPVSGGRLLE